MEDQLEALDGYRRDRAVWLSEEANAKIDQLITMFYDSLNELRERLEEEEDEDAAAKPVYDIRTMETGDQMLDIFDKLVKSL